MRTMRLLVLLVSTALAAHGQHGFKVLHAFGKWNDGALVLDSVTLDKSGRVYGVTTSGGTNHGGTAFQLTLGPGGRWRETILHKFYVSPTDGAAPTGGLLLGGSGTLYGTTQAGGGDGAGTVFELAPGLHGWKETILYSFGDNDLACCPWGNLVMDQEGNLYGTGNSAFELSPDPKGWTETILHEFTGDNGDGFDLQAGPIRDAAGNLYGTTNMGGGSKECGDGCGTVWELSPPASPSEAGARTEHILHRFGAGDKLAFPGAGQLAMDSQGNLYGAVLGGTHLAGVIYELSPTPDFLGTGDTWQETILYNFTGGADGSYPVGVILGEDGNLYGVTGLGGTGGNGVVFELSPQAGGRWKFTVLHGFNGHDGSSPTANLTFGPDGKLYGTTSTAGPYAGGVVFQLTP